jgi:hypothetical protein
VGGSARGVRFVTVTKVGPLATIQVPDESSRHPNRRILFASTHGGDRLRLIRAMQGGCERLRRTLPMSNPPLAYPDNARDKSAPRWDLSQERAFIENLLGQRFNFLLVFFSIFIAGAVQARDWPLLQAIVLSLGAAIALCLMLAIGRTQQKLDIVLGLLFSDYTHPATIVNNLAGRGSRRRMVGYVVPCICFASLLLWPIIAWTQYVAAMLLRGHQ